MLIANVNITEYRMHRLNLINQKFNYHMSLNKRSNSYVKIKVTDDDIKQQRQQNNKNKNIRIELNITRFRTVDSHFNINFWYLNINGAHTKIKQKYKQSLKLFCKQC